MSGENANRKNKDVEWLPKHQESFEQLKELSSKSLVLAYANSKRPFKVYTDASEKGLGEVLAQNQEDGSEPAIAFASRTQSKAEKRYDAHKLEFLASNGQLLIVFMNIYMVVNSRCTQTKIR